MQNEDPARQLETLCNSTADALAAAVASSDFQSLVEAGAGAAEIVAEAAERIDRALDLLGQAFYLLDEESGSFTLAHCTPSHLADFFDAAAGLHGRGGSLLEKLKGQGPEFSCIELESPGRRLLIQPLASCGRNAGVFVGLIHGDNYARHVLHLLQLILRHAANALLQAKRRTALSAQVRRLQLQSDALAQREPRCSRLFEASPLALALVAPSGEIIDVNPAFEGMFGYTPADAVGLPCSSLVMPESTAEALCSLHEAMLNGQSATRDMTARTFNGQALPVSFLGYPLKRGDTVETLLYSFQDASSRKALEEELTYKAFHDSLTGLPNRALFLERLNRAIMRRTRDRSHNFALFLLDIDRFKGINDSMGHLMGDRLLQEIAGRLAASVRDVDTVARFGGDEFAVLLEGFHGPSEVVSVAKRCCNAMEQSFHISEKSIYTGASIGVVLRSDSDSSPEELLRLADIAMYRAKESGGNRFKVFNQAMLSSAFLTSSMESELRRALDQGQFALHYQPIMDLSADGLCGFEALVRWNHPDRGCVSPSEFILQAEESGLIEPIGEWVLYEACRQLKAWQERFPKERPLSMNVNLSPRQMRLNSLPHSVEAALRNSGAAPGSLQLELSEASMMANMKRCIELFERLKSLDLQLLIDDFGIGYSSLSFLHQFPIDYLKIDRSFICNNGSQMMAKPELVNMVMALARSMNIRTVAEGVEHRSQLDELKRLECPLAQGYFFAPPLESSAAEAMLAGFRNGGCTA